MDRPYLESFTNEQLEHYLSTLQRRVRVDLKDLTLQLGIENQQLGQAYQELIQQKTFVYHRNQEKKNSWGNWINKSKEKIGSFLHITQKAQQEENGSPFHVKTGYEPQDNNHNEYISPKKQGLLAKGKERLNKIFQTSKPAQSLHHQERFSQLRSRLPQHHLYLQIEDALNPRKRYEPQPENDQRYKEFVKRTQEINLRMQPGREVSAKQHINFNSLREEKKEPLVIQKVVEQEVRQNEKIEISKTVQVQTTVQPSQNSVSSPEPPIVLVKEEVKIQQVVVQPEAAAEQVKQTPNSQLKGQQGEKHQQEASSPSKKIEKQQDQIIQAAEPPHEENLQNQYVVKYEQPLQNYELQEKQVFQIVEKSVPSQEDFGSPTTPSNKIAQKQSETLKE